MNSLKTILLAPICSDKRIAQDTMLLCGLVEHVNDTIAIEAEATNIPAELAVSIEGLEVGSAVRASDVPLPQGVTLSAEPETVVIHVLSAQQASAEPETAEEGAAETAAEGEAALEESQEDSA